MGDMDAIRALLLPHPAGPAFLLGWGKGRVGVSAQFLSGVGPHCQRSFLCVCGEDVLCASKYNYETSSLKQRCGTLWVQCSHLP